MTKKCKNCEVIKNGAVIKVDNDSNCVFCGRNVGGVQKQRTSQMNRAFHLLLSQVAKEMQAQGIDQRTVLTDLKGYDVPVTDTFLKEVWRSIMVTMFRKTSTTQLTTKEMKDCYDVFQKFVAENYNLEAPWPSLEQMMMAQLESEQYQ